MSKTITNFHVYIILDFPITCRYASVICQSECACLNQTVNIVVFFLYLPKSGSACMQMNRVVPHTKRGNCKEKNLSLTLK